MPHTRTMATAAASSSKGYYGPKEVRPLRVAWPASNGLFGRLAGCTCREAEEGWCKTAGSPQPCLPQALPPLKASGSWGDEDH